MRIIIFDQNGSGRKKIHGINRYGRGVEISQIFSINGSLPELITDPERYLPHDFAADLALDFLHHPTLAQFLATICERKKIPLISAGKKRMPGALTPFTCCGLGYNQILGAYGERFGFPEFCVTLEEQRIVGVQVRRGAPCGLTWEVGGKLIGVEIEQALTLLGREIQCSCLASPTRVDPVAGKSPLHYAGYVHRAALEKAIELAKLGREQAAGL